jgi:NAD(P)-dependent dehydrogenase (short-subunit alcohol dehydrogenase family)
MASALAEAGAAVALTCRDEDRARAAAAELSGQTGSQCVGYDLDVRDGAAVDVTVKRVITELGGLHILVNNAGVNIREPIWEVQDASWETVLETNLGGAMRCGRAAARHLKEQRWGRIINVGSLLSLVGIPSRASYAASKAGLLGLTRAMALDLAPFGVTVNALCPGVFKTEINRPILDDADYLKTFLRQIPLGRMGDPAELKGVAVFLASEASAYMTGAALLVDGGWTTQ